MRAVSRTTRGSLRSVRLGRMCATRAPRASTALLKSSASSPSSFSASRPMNLSRRSEWAWPPSVASRSRRALASRACSSSPDRGSRGSTLKARSTTDIPITLRSAGMVGKASRRSRCFLDAGQHSARRCPFRYTADTRRLPTAPKRRSPVVVARRPLPRITLDESLNAGDDMLNTPLGIGADTASPSAAFARSSAPRGLPFDADRKTSAGIADTLMLLRDRLDPQRRIVHAGDVIYRAGETFSSLYILNTGFFKIVKLTADGREQVVSLKFRGDWMG